MYVIGVDIGTNGTKALLMNETGGIVSTAYRPYPLSHPAPSRVEQAPGDWYAAVAATVREVLPADAGDVRAISFSTQGGSTTALDKDGAPLIPAISWMDTRSGEVSARLSALRGASEWYRANGVSPSPFLSIAHISWLRENLPEVFAGADKFATTLEYINRCLTGRCATDATNALMTGMLDIDAHAWDPFALAAAGISSDRLPEMLPCGARIGTLTEDAARELGLPREVEIINGAHDQYAGSVGCGAIDDGDFMLSCGTAWVLVGAFDRRISDSGMVLLPGRHAVGGRFGAFYSISVGGEALNWAAAQAGLSGAFDQINTEAAQRIGSAGEVFFYPYLNGSTAIDKNPRARGTFAGLSLGSDRYDMLLAVMEGIAFELKRAIGVFQGEGCDIRAIRMTGGAAKSDLWAGILAAVTGRPVIRPDVADIACLGAAMIAGVGCGMFEDYSEARAKCHRAERTLAPDPALAGHYERKYAAYIDRLPAVYGLYE